jgi:hypothetical protein
MLHAVSCVVRVVTWQPQDFWATLLSSMILKPVRIAAS